jgi:hypothetical protein
MDVAGLRAVLRNRGPDSCLGDEAFRSARESLRRGDWRESTHILATRPDRWLYRSILLGLSDDADGIDTATIRRWTDADPTADTISLLGQALIRDAWRIRGTDYAHSVDPAAWAPFHAGLTEAEGVLAEAVRVDPRSEAPWPGLLTTARGLSLGHDTARLRFEACQARAPFHPPACDAYLQSTCSKWSGDNRLMFQFARFIQTAAPPDSPARTALPVAHYEFVGAMRRDNPDFPYMDYFTHPDIVGELTNGLAQFLAATPTPTPPAHLEVLNWYAWAVIPASAQSARCIEECFRRIGDRITYWPWYAMGAGNIRFHATRTRHLRAAKRF